MNEPCPKCVTTNARTNLECDECGPPDYKKFVSKDLWTSIDKEDFKKRMERYNRYGELHQKLLENIKAKLPEL